MKSLKFALGALLCACSLQAAAAPPKNFASNPEVIDFANQMAEKHGFDSAKLLTQFARVRVNPTVIKLIKPPASPLQRSWERYRPRFLNEVRVDGGVHFWQQHRAVLQKAAAEYGVPEEVIVAIIGVETVYGRSKGTFGAMEALATLAFHYPPRAEFFRTELEQLLLLAEENRMDPLAIKGSFAGALGIPQFMPGSLRRYAVDFDGDGRIDLSGSPADAIGSVARFLTQHGWKTGEPVAAPAGLEGEPPHAWIEAGIRPTLKYADLREGGVRGLHEADSERLFTFVDLVTPGAATEYWIGYDNFYVITRYNRSSFYAMAVYQLAEAIRERMLRQP